MGQIHRYGHSATILAALARPVSVWPHCHFRRDTLREADRLLWSCPLWRSPYQLLRRAIVGMGRLAERLRRMDLFRRRKGHYDVRSVTDWFIAKSNADPNLGPLTHMQLHKLAYFSHGWMLGIYEKPMTVQPVRAWKHGPVYQVLYDALKHWRDNDITELIEPDKDLPFDRRTEFILNSVYDRYGPMEAWELSSLTHVPEGPWFLTRLNKFEGAIIDDDLIQEYFSKRKVRRHRD